MFIAHTPNRWTRIRVWFSKHWDWSVLSTHAFGVLGLVFSVLGAANKVFPWHFSLVLVALIGFQSYYCSRYYRLKHERVSPRKGYRAIHDFAEALRENASENNHAYLKQADQGSLTKAQLSKLISNHCDLAHSACKQALEVLKQHGLKIQRVCIKLNVSHEIFTIADQQEAKCTCGDRVRAVETIFWRLLWNVHINYAALKSRDGLRTVRGNADLKEKPRFLAIGSFKRIDPPESFVTIAEVLEKKASSDLTPPSDHRKQAESFWLELRKLIADRYDSCIGVMIGGPPEFSDPLIDGPKSESTRLSIGFIGLDSKDPEIIHLLEQDDLEAVAAMADALYPALRNLKTFMEAYQTVEKALAKGASLPATTTPTP